MDRTFSRLITYLFCVFPLVYWSQTQQKCRVVDENNMGIANVILRSSSGSIISDKNGYLVIPDIKEDGQFCFIRAEKDSICLNFQQLKSNNFSVQFATSKQLDEVAITAKRLQNFDIGYLPPVRGVQIATGTSSIIQTEGQGGAKSTANPRELFAKIPGLNIWESDGAGIQIGVGGRGLSPNRAANFNTRQNGYDISADALGYPESYYTPPLEALSSIEIIRGSASLQYGTQFGGLMNFVVKEPNPDKTFDFTSRNTVGSFGYLGTFQKISGSHKRWSYQAYTQLKKGNGYRKNSGFNQEQYFLQLSYAINEKQKVRLEYTRMNYLAQQPGGLNMDSLLKNPRMSLRDRNWFKVNWNILAAHYDWEINTRTRFNIRMFAMNSQRFSLGFLDGINKIDPGIKRDLIRGDFKNAGLEARFLKIYTLPKSKIRSAFLVGSRLYKGTTTSLQGAGKIGTEVDFNFLNPTNLENSSYNFPSENASFFIDNIFFINPKLSFNLGARFEYITSSSVGFYKRYLLAPGNALDTFRIDVFNSEREVKRKVPLFGIGGSYKTNKSTSIYTNFCMNYRAINFNDIRIVNPNVTVDSLIKDEYGYTEELGFRGFIQPNWYVDIAGFYLFYGDKIGIAPDKLKKIRKNIGDAVNYGVEFFTEYDFAKLVNDSSKYSFTSFVNFSYIQAKYINSDEPSYVGKKVEYVSPIIFRTGLKFKSEKWQVQLQYSYNSSQFSDATNAIQESADAVIGLIPSYQVLDFSARVQLKKWIQFEVGINNLTNSNYFTRRATSYPGPGILPSDGRSFYATVQFNLRSKK